MPSIYRFGRPDGDLDWSKGNVKFGVMWENARRHLGQHRGQGFRVRHRVPDQGWTHEYTLTELGPFLKGRLDENKAGELFDVKSEKDGWKLTFHRRNVKPEFEPYDKEQWRSRVQNGGIPTNLLAPIVPVQYDTDLGGSAIMHPEAAAAMSALLRVAPPILAVKYSYRTIAKQYEKWADYLRGGNLAAHPGESNHGWGVSVDFTGLTYYASLWLRANARRYGFVNDVPGESWHYTYQEHSWRP